MKKNPFKFGSIVDSPFFINRIEELRQINTILSGNNHIIIISPRRFGKTSLIRKVVGGLDRKILSLDLQLLNSVEDFAAQYLRRIYRIYPAEKIKQFIVNFRIIPTINLNPVNGEMEFSFSGKTADTPILEDVLNLLEHLSSPKNRPVVILDEFQDILRLGTGLDRQLRSIIQLHQNINYVFLGSQESMMRDIFEKKKSPFFHFGLLLSIQKINHEEFREFLVNGFKNVLKDQNKIADEILDLTDGHPYYTQQLAFHVWNSANYESDSENIVANAINEIIQSHDLNFERIWNTFNNTDKLTLINLVKSDIYATTPLSKSNTTSPTSTLFSSLKRLQKSGVVIKSKKKYEIDDPFFMKWIILRRNSY